MNKPAILLLFGALIATQLSACGKKAIDDQDEIAQSVGDTMASADEAGGSSGAIAWQGFSEGRRLASAADRLLAAILPEAQATSCFLYGWGSCATHAITRTYGGCTVGGATLTGSVAFDFANGDNDCNLDVGETMTRSPDFTITGRRGGTLSVQGTGASFAGQQLTRTATDAFNYKVLGVNRKMTAGGSTLFDITTRTTSDITVTGLTRGTRVMNGGTLEITHNLKNYAVALSPANLAWTTTCNCASSGRLTGKVTGDQTSDDFTIEITGCGSARVTANGESSDVTFDRCSGS